MGGKTKHLSDGGKYKAVWGQHGDYRQNTIDGIKAKADRRAVYDNDAILSQTLSSIQPKPSRLPATLGQPIPAGGPEHRSRYKLNQFTARGAKTPYPNEAHHMIPANSFINKFTTEQKDILYQIEYDVNNKNNLIFLPRSAQFSNVHMLPWHRESDFHEKYSRKVKNYATDIKDSINKILDSAEPCEEQDPPKDLVDQMVDLENTLWDVIVNLGPKSINDVVMP